MAFQDHFSQHAADYARFRPRYPEALFAYLAGLCDARARAWDCGTGNGQAAVALAAHFDHVAATDASPQQIAQAETNSKVIYRVATEQQSGLADESIDLVTVAQALHWFDTAAFFVEVRRVLKPRGVVAVWCYGLNVLGEPLDALLQQFYRETVGPYWPPERVLVENGYATIEFPFDELSPPEFAMQQELSLTGLVNYLGTWSATKRFEQARGFNPLPELELQLRAHWGEENLPRTVRWPLKMRVGRRR